MHVARQLVLTALEGVPIARAGDDVAVLVVDALRANELAPQTADVLVITSKLCSRAEGRFVDLGSVDASSKAHELAQATERDPRLVELILRESVAVSRATPAALIVRHRLGFVCANAGIDASNARPHDAAPDSGPWVLLLPSDPDAAARRIRAAVRAAFDIDVGVIISDSHGRPFRRGSSGVAIGLAGLRAVSDERGRSDLHARQLEHTIAAVADPLAAAADLLAGQADEARPIVHVRGIVAPAGGTDDESARAAQRDPDEDLYA